MLSKKKLTQMFLRKEDREETESSIPFDENYFQLHTDFNGTNFSLISISATILKGEKSKQKLNLKCKWYLKTPDDFKEISEISGNYYQPCIDDIGSIISVQIEPFMEDREYEGITIVKQFGPIKIDSRLETFQATISKAKQYKRNAKLETVFSSDEKYSYLELPLDVTMVISKEFVEMLYKQQSLFRSDNSQVHPTIEAIRKTFNSMILTVGDESFRLTADDNMRRDQLMITLKTFTTGCQTTEHETELDLILRTEQLSKTNNSLKKELQTLKIEHEHAFKSKACLEEESTILKKKLVNFDSLQTGFEQLKKENIQLKSQNSYYITEISIYKKLDKEKASTIQQLTYQLLELTAVCNSKDQQTRSELQDKEKQVQLLIEQRELLELELDKHAQIKLETQAQAQEKLEYIHRLQRKHNDLKQDRSVIDDTKSKREHNERELEVQALRSQIFNLQNLLTKHKNDQKETRRIWDIKNLLTGLKSSKNGGEATIYLQKLVANLTQTVTQKQIQLTNQRESNKILNQQLLKYKSGHPTPVGESLGDGR